MRQQHSGRPGQRRRQRDVAAAAGVSEATVSMVLNGRTGKGAAISAATRERVRQAAAELGYAVNPVARSLAGGRNNLLGVYTFVPVFPAEGADFYHPFLVGVEREAEALGYDLVLFTSAAGSDGQRRIYRDGVHRLRMADGCILFGNDSDRGELDRLAEEEFPFVFIGRRELPGREIAYVGADYAGATAKAVGRLVELGHRRVAYLGSGRGFEPMADRVAGYRLAVEQFGLESDPRLRLKLSGRSLQPAEVRELLGLGVTAFVAEGDAAMRQILKLAEDLDLRVPRDFSLVTLAGNSTGDREVDGLRVPRREMGATAVRMLVDMLGGASLEPRRQVVLPCSLVTGKTTGGPPARAGEVR